MYHVENNIHESIVSEKQHAQVRKKITPTARKFVSIIFRNRTKKKSMKYDLLVTKLNISRLKFNLRSNLKLCSIYKIYLFCTKTN